MPAQEQCTATVSAALGGRCTKTQGHDGPHVNKQPVTWANTDDVKKYYTNPRGK